MRVIAYGVLVIGLVTLLAWLAVAPLSVMAFDAGPSPLAYGFVGLVLAYPVWLLSWLWGGWRKLRAGGDTAHAGKAIAYALAGIGPAAVLYLVIAVTGR